MSRSALIYTQRPKNMALASKSNLKRSLAALVFLVGGVFAPSFLSGQTTRILVSAPSKSATWFPAVVAREKGFYRTEGLDVDFVIMKPQVAMQAVFQKSRRNGYANPVSRRPARAPARQRAQVPERGTRFSRPHRWPYEPGIADYQRSSGRLSKTQGDSHRIRDCLDQS